LNIVKSNFICFDWHEIFLNKNQYKQIRELLIKNSKQL
jgi:hypothetical protein